LAGSPYLGIIPKATKLQLKIIILGIDSPNSEVDIELMFRRAVILSSILKNNAASILHKDKNTANIDKDVVMAFLKIPRYKHGTCSMEAIIQMSLLEKGKKITASSLPARAQLNMHVDADQFLSLMRGLAIITIEMW